LSLFISGCSGIDMAPLKEKSRKYESSRNYQLIYKDYVNWIHRCGMPGWRVFPILTPELKEANIAVSNMTSALIHVSITEKSEKYSIVEYSHGLWGDSDKIWSALKKAGQESYAPCL
jgi:hypothetical protein